MPDIVRGTIGLAVGDRVLTDEGYRIVTALGRHAATMETSAGESVVVGYRDIAGVGIDGDLVEPRIASLEPWWSGVSESARRNALDRLEVVLEVLTGYRWGDPRLAQPGEPYPPFGDPGTSISQRCARMAEQLSYERSNDRLVVRRVHDAELRSSTVSSNTVLHWIRSWRRDGLRGLVDQRAVKVRQGFDAIDERVRRIADDVFARFDGDASKVNTTTIEAEIRLQMNAEGLVDLRVPERIFQEYLSERQRGLGPSTRAHRSRTLRRKASAHTSFPAMHLSHLALDATRADVLVWDELRERPVSVEVLTLISVATRVVVALRVTPRSGNALEAGLVLYDAMRPMSMLVEGTTVEVPRSRPRGGRVDPPGEGLGRTRGARARRGRCDILDQVRLSQRAQDAEVDLTRADGGRRTSGRRATG